MKTLLYSSRSFYTGKLSTLLKYGYKDNIYIYIRQIHENKFKKC